MTASTIVLPASLAAKLKQAAKDVLTYGAPVVAVLEVVANLAPHLGVPAADQAVISTLVGVATAIMSWAKQDAEAKAVAAAKTAAR